MLCRRAEQHDTSTTRQPEELDRLFEGNGADVAVELATQAMGFGILIATITGDNDTATIRRFRVAVDHDVEKWSDISHAMHAFGNRLYVIKSAHRQLFEKVTKYVQKSFTRGDPRVLPTFGLTFCCRECHVHT